MRDRCTRGTRLSALVAAAALAAACGGTLEDPAPAGDDTGGALDETPGGIDPGDGTTDGTTDGSTDGSTDGEPAPCVPTTCESAGKNCGSIDDGCGARIDCGACPAGQVCGLTALNECGTPGCAPTTCAAAGKTCGTAPDGCGGTLDCGPCAPPACSYTYSAWGACQPNGTQTRTVASASPAGCTGTPALTQSCTYTAPACTYTYSAWGACQSNGTQTRTVASSSPSGCSGTPVLSQSCTYTPPTASCTTCHGNPPSTGDHSKHRSYACSRCHGTGYSSTAVNSATHNDGTKNIASGAGWSSGSRTCSNSCHGTESW